ncbi:MAG: biotin--[acetyl-CoA-carboxylase] ligase [Puniceicoccales bacterium]|jgi:biotin-[acetyl-CoA-carboxylase] ligase BirA-like protein|nr:biotin--[acetyl-CoA-carboxylase] ligase [Puniceicoccales bacterium]
MDTVSVPKSLEATLQANGLLKIFNFRFLEEVASTQDVARTLVEAEGRPAIVLAGRQSAGRGRCGRRWIGEKEGNIYLSLAIDCVRPDCDRAAFAFRLTQRIAKHFREKFSVPLMSVPPNDLALEEKKVGGVLVESIGAEDKMIVGIGMNLVHDDELQSHCAQPVGSIDASRTLEWKEAVFLLCLAVAEFLPELRTSSGPAK